MRNNIERLIFECVKETIDYNLKKQHIKNIVLEEYRKQLHENENDDSSTDMKRKAVMNKLKDPKYNHAQLAYSLYHPKDQSEKDTVRSLFSKKATGNPDNDGAIRHFDEEEINKLYQMIRKQ